MEISERLNWQTWESELRSTASVSKSGTMSPFSFVQEEYSRSKPMHEMIAPRAEQSSTFNFRVKSGPFLRITERRFGYEWVQEKARGTNFESSVIVSMAYSICFISSMNHVVGVVGGRESCRTSSKINWLNRWLSPRKVQTRSMIGMYPKIDSRSSLGNVSRQLAMTEF